MRYVVHGLQRSGLGVQDLVRDRLRYVVQGLGYAQGSAWGWGFS